MTQDKWKAVDDYINHWLLPADPILESALQASEKAGLDPINVAPNQGKFLHLLAKIQGAKRILEIGTLGGFSTIWLARALPPGGRLVTLEINPKNAETAKANIKRAGFGEVVEVRLGPASESLAKLVSEKGGSFDFIFIDADKPGYHEYLSWALKLSRDGTVILLDNMVRKGEIVSAAEGDPRVVGARAVYEMLSKEPRVSATAIQTVGVKGHDGFVMAMVIA
jgi:predicted O-methyltransferase YrrM